MIRTNKNNFLHNLLLTNRLAEARPFFVPTCGMWNLKSGNKARFRKIMHTVFSYKNYQQVNGAKSTPLNPLATDIWGYLPKYQKKKLDLTHSFPIHPFFTS